MPPVLLISSTAILMPSDCGTPMVEATPDSSHRAPIRISSSARACRHRSGVAARASDPPAVIERK
jgi:hypothetical protein